MSVESEIYTRLSTYAGLTALVVAKIYPLQLPQDIELPALTYFKVSDVPEHAMGADANIKTTRIQVSCWAETYGEAKALELQVKAVEKTMEDRRDQHAHRDQQHHAGE